MKIAIMMSDGCEEIEALAVVDLLRRAEIAIDMVRVPSPEAGKELAITGSHGIAISMDKEISDFSQDDYGGIVLPGGMPGTNHLAACEVVTDAVKAFAADGKLVAAICAAPSVLGTLGLLEGKRATCYPGFESKLLGAVTAGARLERDGNFITARGMGCAVDFGLEIVSYLKSKEEADQLREKVIG